MPLERMAYELDERYMAGGPVFKKPIVMGGYETFGLET